MTSVLIAAELLGATAAGYLAGRFRPGQRALEWAEDRDRGPHGPGWWVAQAIGLAAVVWALTVHPRRSAANRRSWREARNIRRSPAIRIDPRWAANRRTSTRLEGDDQQ